MNKRILIVSPGDSRSGAGLIRHAVACSLARAGHPVALAQPVEDGPLQAEEAALGIEHHFFSRNPYDDIRAFAQDRGLAAAELRRSAPDLVLFSSGVSPSCNYSFLEAVTEARLPYLMIEHQVGVRLFAFEPPLRERFAQFYADAAAVAAASEGNLRLLRQCLGLPDSVGRVLVCGRPAAFFRPRDAAGRAALRREWGVPGDALVALTVARLEPIKGHRFLIEAMRRLRKEPIWEKLFFVWVGDGSGREGLERRLAEAGVDDHVRLLGHRWETAPLYDGGDLLVMPSLSEGMPLVVMEGMAKGLPPVCSDVGGTAEAVGDAGVLLPAPTDEGRAVAELTAALRMLAGDAPRREELSERARRRAAALFREDRMIEEYFDLVAHGLAARPARSPLEPPPAPREAALRINLINLDRSADRLGEFMTVNRHLRDVGRWSAVDGSGLDLTALVEQGVVGREVASNFSRGSLGAAFSHIGLWERAIETEQPLTISEDDAIYHRDFEAHAAAMLRRRPPDCDIVLWGWNFDAAVLFAMLPGVSPCLASFDQAALRAGAAKFQAQLLAPQLFRLYMAFGIMCYTIFPGGARALKNLCLPLRGDKFYFPGLQREVTNYGIDITMAAVYPQINAYVCFPPIVVSKNEHTKSLSITTASGWRPD